MTILPFHWLLIPFGVLLLGLLVWEAVRVKPAGFGGLWRNEHWLGTGALAPERQLWADRVFVVAAALYMLRAALFYSQLPGTFDWINTACAVLFDCTFMLCMFKTTALTRYSWKQLLALGIVLGLFMLAQYQVPNHATFLGLVLILAAKDAPLRRALVPMLAGLCAGLVAVLCCYFAGILPDNTEYFVRTEEEFRTSLGMWHPNTMGMMLLAIVFLWALLRLEQAHWFEWLLPLGALAVSFWLLDSRNTQLSLIVFLLCGLPLRIWPDLAQNRVVRFLVPTAWVVAGAGSLGVGFFYGETPLWGALNVLSSDRFRLFSLAIKKTEVHLFGGSEFPEGLFALDNVFLYTLYFTGAVWFVLWCVGMFFVVRRCAQRGAGPEMLVAVSILPHLLLEYTGILPIANPLLLLLPCVLYGLPVTGTMLFNQRDGQRNYLGQSKAYFWTTRRGR